MSIKSGDFLLINYTLTVKETGETVGTTIESVAKDKKLYHGEEKYEPFFVVVGEGWVPKGLDEALSRFELSKPNQIELTPEKAYGERDPKKVRLVPLRKFTSEGMNPVPGLQVNLEGKSALVRAVGAGRVQVDYNHPFAGRTLEYDVTIEKIIESDEEKVKNLLHKRLPSVAQEKFSVNVENGKLQVEIPEEAFFIEGLQVVKQTVTADFGKFFPKIETVTFIENFKKPPAVPPAASEVSEATAPTVAPSTST